MMDWNPRRHGLLQRDHGDYLEWRNSSTPNTIAAPPMMQRTPIRILFELVTSDVFVRLNARANPHPHIRALNGFPSVRNLRLVGQNALPHLTLPNPYVGLEFHNVKGFSLEHARDFYLRRHQRDISVYAHSGLGNCECFSREVTRPDAIGESRGPFAYTAYGGNRRPVLIQLLRNAVGIVVAYRPLQPLIRH